MAKRKKKGIPRALIIGFVFIFAVIAYISIFAQQQKFVPEDNLWCFPQYGSATCSVLTGYYVKPDRTTEQGSPVNIPVTTLSGSSLNGNTFLCPENANACRFTLKVGTLSFSQKGDSNVIIFEYRPKVGSDSMGAIGTGTEQNFALSSEQLATFGIPTLRSGDELEIGFYDAKFFTKCGFYEKGVECSINDADYDDPINSLNTAINADIKYLDVISASGFRGSITEFGCDLDEALGSVGSITYDNSEIITSNTDSSRVSKNCDQRNCEYPGTVNWKEGESCSPSIFPGGDGTVDYKGDTFVCEQGVGGKLYTIGELKTESGTFRYPQTLKYTVACCPDRIIGNKICKQDGDNFFLDDINKPENRNALSCNKDNDCPGSALSFQYNPESKNGDFWGCNLVTNKCEITKSIKLECSPEKRCEFGICSGSTGQCVSIEEGDVNKGNLGQKDDLSYLPYLIVTIALVLILILVLMGKSGGGSQGTSQNGEAE